MGFPWVCRQFISELQWPSHRQATQSYQVMVRFVSMVNKIVGRNRRLLNSHYIDTISLCCKWQLLSTTMLDVSACNDKKILLKSAFHLPFSSPLHSAMGSTYKQIHIPIITVINIGTKKYLVWLLHEMNWNQILPSLWKKTTADTETQMPFFFFFPEDTPDSKLKARNWKKFWKHKN